MDGSARWGLRRAIATALVIGSPIGTENGPRKFVRPWRIESLFEFEPEPILPMVLVLIVYIGDDPR